MNVLGSVSVWLVLGCGACSVDDRELTLAMGSGGGSGSGGAGQTAGSGGRTPSGGGADAGAGGESADGLVDGCADLDTDGVADCTTTLVTTPSFTEDVSGWVAVDDATLTWDEKNALADVPSGSAKLTASTSRASAAQCLELPGRQLVIAYAQVLAPAAPGAEGVAQAQLRVAFFERDDCTGEPSGFFETPPSTEADVWSTVQAGGLSDEAAQSMSVALVGVKASDAQQLNVHFDNVMLKTKDPG